MTRNIEWRGVLVCVPLVLLLSSCSQVQTEQTSYHDEVYSEVSANGGAGVHGRALAQLPPSAGRILSVQETTKGSNLTQRIVLQGLPGTIGTNFIEVRVSRRAKYGHGASEKSLLREINSTVPGRRFRIANVVPSNGYGPFGVASDQIGCTFLWQTIDTPAKTRFGFLEPKKTRTVDVRVRLCEGRSNERRAIALMQRLNLYVDGIPRNDFAALESVDELLTSDDSVLYPRPEKRAPVRSQPKKVAAKPAPRELTSPVFEAPVTNEPLEPVPHYLVPVPPPTDDIEVPETRERWAQPVVPLPNVEPVAVTNPVTELGKQIQEDARVRDVTASAVPVPLP